MTNFYFDMDGVLAVYEKSAYPPKSNLYCEVGKHYFRTVKPDNKMINVFKKLNKEIKTQSHRTFDIRVLTSLSYQGKIFLEQMSDKKEWLKEHFGEEPAFPVLFAASHKRYIGEALSDNRKLTRNDILIDDYNENLTEWEKNGGTSVKYCNTINNPNSWNGFCITEDMTEDEICDFLKAIATSYNITAKVNTYPKGDDLNVSKFL